MTQEQLYDSEATLRLVGRVLEELDATDPAVVSLEGRPGYRTEQLRSGAAGAEGDASPDPLRAFWEIHDALELLRDSHAALRPSLEEPDAAEGDPRDRLDRALAMVDQMQSEEADAGRGQAHAELRGELRGELLALADHLRSREAVTDRLHLTADLLQDLEGRLAQLARAFEPTDG